MDLCNEELFTARLHMRRPVAADADAVIAIAGDWQIARRLGRMPHPYARSDFDFFLAHIVPVEHTWAVLLRQTAQLVGVIGLTPLKDRSSAELGYYLGRAWWDAGLATEAGAAVVRFALERMRYPKLTSRFHADNPASGRVLAKLGFQPMRMSHHPCLAEGRDKPSVEMELTPAG